MWPPTKEVLKELRHDIRFEGTPSGGWRAKRLRGGKITIYVHPKHKLVCKAPTVLIGKEKVGVTLPTIHLRGSDGWVVQPLCTFEDREQAHTEVLRRIGPESERKWFDCHIWNVGRWRGKSYLFDW